MPSSVSLDSLARRLDANVVTLSKHIAKCEASNDRVDANIDALVADVAAMAADIKAFKGLPAKAARWLLLTVGSAMVALIVQNFVLHEDAVRNAQKAAQSAQSAAVAAKAIPAETADAVITKLTTPP